MEKLSEIICSNCRSKEPAGSFFCSNCGKQLREKPPAATIARQITVYSVSLFLPPFGLWYAWKYLKQADPSLRKIGIAAIILTFVSVLFSIWITEKAINSVNQSLDVFNSLYF
jgi:hypothetical protein